MITNVIGTTEIDQMQLITAFLNKFAKRTLILYEQENQSCGLLRDYVQRKSQVTSLAWLERACSQRPQNLTSLPPFTGTQCSWPFKFGARFESGLFGFLRTSLQESFRIFEIKNDVWSRQQQWPWTKTTSEFFVWCKACIFTLSNERCKLMRELVSKGSIVMSKRPKK